MVIQSLSDGHKHKYGQMLVIKFPHRQKCGQMSSTVQVIDISLAKWSSFNLSMDRSKAKLSSNSPTHWRMAKLTSNVQVMDISMAKWSQISWQAENCSQMVIKFTNRQKDGQWSFKVWVMDISMAKWSSNSQTARCLAKLSSSSTVQVSDRHKLGQMVIQFFNG